MKGSITPDGFGMASIGQRSQSVPKILRLKWARLDALVEGASREARGC